MTTEPTWHGLRHEQWMRIFDEKNWREEVATALREVALCRGAEAADRLVATQTLNEAIQNGALAHDVGYPELLRDVLIDVAKHGRRGRKKLRKKMHARLVGARWMLNTIYQLLPPRQAEPEAPAPAVQVIDLSQMS